MNGLVRRIAVVTAAALVPITSSVVLAPAAHAATAPLVHDYDMANLAANERELSIAVDPANADHLVAGANLRNNTPSTQEWYTSTDGGRNWTTGALAYGTLTVAGTTSQLMSDPEVSFGASGRIYYSALAHGATSEPCTMFVSTSTDDGANWSDPANGVVASGGGTICNDKQGMLVDALHNDDVFVAWTPFGGTNNNELVVSRDLNGAGDGLAFGAQTVVSTDGAEDGCINHGADLAESADGTLWLAWSTFCNGLTDGADSNVWVSRSTDHGSNWSAPDKIADIDNFNAALDGAGGGFRARSFPSIDVDKGSGRAYVVVTDYTGASDTDADIVLYTSTDGTTWTGATVVNPDTAAATQYMPWVATGGGRVMVGYYGTDSTNTNTNHYVAYGSLGATPTFTEVRVSAANTPVSTGFLGDYTGAAYGSDDVLHTAWGDGRSGAGGATDSYASRVDFSPPDTVTAVASPASLYWGQSTTVTATVKGNGSELEHFIPVSFTVSSSGTPSATSASGNTGSTGTFSFSYSNGTAGSDTVTAWADLNENGVQDSGETSAATVSWNGHPTASAYTGPTSGTYTDSFTATGTLTDTLLNVPVSGQTLTLGFGTDTCTGTTNGSGVASCTITPAQVPGPYSATASFAGSGQYAASTSPGVAFTLNKETTVLSMASPAFAGNGDPATLGAILTEDDGPAVVGRSVTLTLGTGAGAQSCVGVTGATGKATCTIASVNQPLGPVPVTGNFAGDAYYLPSSASGSLIVFAWTPGGNFVIGDGNATTGGTATFWGDDWNQRNTVSGGRAPSAFKGFANTPAGKTTCGGTWTTTGGNSAPPASAVPAYTAMLVSSIVTKSGNIITGTKPSIAIVHVNPGYSPSPGKRGTAVVLGLLCP